jgi:hypothetical protein
MIGCRACAPATAIPHKSVCLCGTAGPRRRPGPPQRGGGQGNGASGRRPRIVHGKPFRPRNRAAAARIPASRRPTSVIRRRAILVFCLRPPSRCAVASPSRTKPRNVPIPKPRASIVDSVLPSGEPASSRSASSCSAPTAIYRARFFQAGRTSAPTVPHFEHSMIGPNSATGMSSGHWSTPMKALCWHFGHDTASVALTFWRGMLSVAGSVGSLRRGRAIRRR